jgi:uncharacterized protein
VTDIDGSQTGPTLQGPAIIDTDVHNTMGDLIPYLPKQWHDTWRAQHIGAPGMWRNPRGVSRRDADTPDGGAPASDPWFLIEDHLDRFDIDYAVLTGPGGIRLTPDPDYCNAIVSAYNEGLIERWLGVSDRLKGSIMVNGNDPGSAATEIRRHAKHPDMVQVIMSSTTLMPLGNRFYHPIYEAAVECGLPVAIHPGAEGAGMAYPPTPAGYPSTYIEWHNIIPINYMAQVNSMVCEGVFEKFPSLMLVALEGGLAWLPHLMWRMNKNYKALRDTVPWLKQLPSEYVKQHVRLSTQPIEEPEQPSQMRSMLEMMSAEQTVVFSSDYPHWDNDNPRMTLRQIDPGMRQRIMAGTAAEVYGLHRSPDRTLRSRPTEQTFQDRGLAEAGYVE